MQVKLKSVGGLRFRQCSQCHINDLGNKYRSIGYKRFSNVRCGCFYCFIAFLFTIFLKVPLILDVLSEGR